MFVDRKALATLITAIASAFGLYMHGWFATHGDVVFALGVALQIVQALMPPAVPTVPPTVIPATAGTAQITAQVKEEKNVDKP